MSAFTFDYREYPAPAYIRETVDKLREMRGTPHLSAAGRAVFDAAIKDLEDYGHLLEQAYLHALRSKQ